MVDIIKANNQLKRKIAENARIEVVNDWTKLLQYHCATLIDNDIPGLSQAAHRSGRALKSIRQRLKGKEGRIRNNLMGKRVDFSARSVITPDPNIELDELGVPLKIATNLTYPECVNIYNIERLTNMLKKDAKWPSIKSINKRNMKITVMDSNRDSIELEIGDIWSSMRHAGRKYEDFPKAHRGQGQVLPAEMQVIAETAMTTLATAFANLPTDAQTILERTCYLGLGKRGGGHTMETLTNYITNHCLNNIVQAYKSGRFVDEKPHDDNGVIMVELPAIKPKKEKAEVAEE